MNSGRDTPAIAVLTKGIQPFSSPTPTFSTPRYCFLLPRSTLRRTANLQGARAGCVRAGTPSFTRMSKTRKVVSAMNDKRTSGERTTMVKVKSECGTRIYKCDEQQCYMVGEYGVAAC